jgi:hypothetical protein
MIYSNISKYSNLTFPQYLAIKDVHFNQTGNTLHSHSSLKNMKDGIQQPYKSATPKMQIGTLVDEILTGSADVNHPNYATAKAIALALRSRFGFAFDKMEKQVSYTATIEHDGLKLDVMGRPDYVLAKNAIIDLKISQVRTRQEASNIADHFGYDNALWHYGQMAGASKYYILVYCAKSGNIEVIERECKGAEGWWCDKVLLYGY